MVFVSALAKLHAMSRDILECRSTVIYIEYSVFTELPGSDGCDLQYNVWLEVGFIFSFPGIEC